MEGLVAGLVIIYVLILPTELAKKVCPRLCELTPGPEAHFVGHTRNMVYKKHREIQYSYVSKIDLNIQ